VIVIDASALAKYILKEPGWREINKLIAENDVVSVNLVLVEVANAIWKNTVVFRGDDVSTAYERYRLLKRLVSEGVIELEDEARFLDDALGIALETRLTIYDSLCLAQAQRRGAILLTSDKKQGEVAEKLGIRTMIIM
jgi:predicted nucleic acid-binding protein